jgi:anti-anti-sigma factor
MVPRTTAARLGGFRVTRQRGAQSREHTVLWPVPVGTTVGTGRHETVDGRSTTAGVPVSHLQVALVPAPDQVVVRMTGDADVSTVPRLTDALQEAAGLGTRRVVVDVAGVRFWDCSGLHALVVFTAALAPTGRQCRVVGAPATTRRLVRAAGLADRLELDGPLGGDDPVRTPDVVAPAPLPPVPLPPVQVPPVQVPPPVRRAVTSHQVRVVRRGEDRPPRRERIGALRRWR